MNRMDACSHDSVLIGKIFLIEFPAKKDRTPERRSYFIFYKKNSPTRPYKYLDSRDDFPFPINNYQGRIFSYNEVTMLRINTNLAAINAQKNLFGIDIQLRKSMARLASGQRINSASDDAAGLAVSETLRAKVRGLKQAQRNANDGISMVQVAEGGLNTISNSLIRLRELAIQSASDTISDKERSMVDVEYQQLKAEVERVTSATEFNGTTLLNGDGGYLEVQVGVHNDPTLDRVGFDASQADASVEALGIVAENVLSKEAAQNSLGVIDSALVSINQMRARFGAVQNRLESVVNNIAIAHENLSAANSRIRDTDYAEESANMAKQMILKQAGVSMLAQANGLNQLALKLIG